MAVEFKSSPLFCIVVHWLQYECQRIWHGMTWDDAVYFVCWRWRHCWCCLPGVFCCFIDGNTGQRTPARVNNNFLLNDFHDTSPSIPKEMFISPGFYEILEFQKKLTPQLYKRNQRAYRLIFFLFAETRWETKKRVRSRNFSCRRKMTPGIFPIWVSNLLLGEVRYVFFFLIYAYHPHSNCAALMLPFCRGFRMWNLRLVHCTLNWCRYHVFQSVRILTHTMAKVTLH